MAKVKEKNIVNEEVEQEERKPGIFQKIFVLGIIPLLFIVTVLLILSMFTSINVFEKAKDLTSAIPFLSSGNESSPVNADELVKLQAQIKEKEIQLEQIKSELDKATKDNQTLTTEKEKLQFEIDKLKQAQQQATIDFKSVIATYEAMAPEAAAPVIVKMNQAEALRVLTGLKPETLAAVLSKMPADAAAKYTEIMAKQ